MVKSRESGKAASEMFKKGAVREHMMNSQWTLHELLSEMRDFLLSKETFGIKIAELFSRMA